MNAVAMQIPPPNPIHPKPIHPKSQHKLRPRELFFCLEYFKTSNQTQSALAAGYSPKSAQNAAYRLLRMPRIRAEIDRLSELSGLTEAFVMNSLQEIARDPKTRNSDKIRALELCGKRLGLFTDRVEVDVTNLAERVARARAQVLVGEQDARTVETDSSSGAVGALGSGGRES